MKKLNVSKSKIISLYNQGFSCQKIADNLKCSESYINKSLKAKGIIKRSNKVYRTKQIFNHDLFSSINNEISAYWLGFLMADGCIMNKISGQKMIVLCVKDLEVTEKFIKSIDGNFKPKTYKDVYGVYLTSEQMFNDLVMLGCIPRKSLVLKFPELNSNVIHHFIRGYFDGDGCVSITHPKNKSNTSTIYTLSLIHI